MTKPILKQKWNAKTILHRKIDIKMLFLFLGIAAIIFVYGYQTGYTAGVNNTISVILYHSQIKYHFIPNNPNGTNNLSPFNCTIGISGNNNSITYYLNTRQNGNVIFDGDNCLGIVVSTHN